MFHETSSTGLVPASRSSQPSTCAEDEGQRRQARISELLPYFSAYLLHELHRSRETAQKYLDCMTWVIRSIGDIPPVAIRPQHVTLIKADCAGRNAGPARIASHVNALKSFLNFCRLAVGLETIDPKQFKAPKIPKREVAFLPQKKCRSLSPRSSCAKARGSSICGGFVSGPWSKCCSGPACVCRKPCRLRARR